jgi:hypothetical protein
MNPIMSLSNILNALWMNFKSLSDNLALQATTQQSHNFLHFLFCKFRRPTITAMRIASVQFGMNGIRPTCYPFKIVGVIIQSVAVFMIHFILTRLVFQECRCNYAVNRYRFSPFTVAECDHTNGILANQLLQYYWMLFVPAFNSSIRTNLVGRKLLNPFPLFHTAIV